MKRLQSRRVFLEMTFGAGCLLYPAVGKADASTGIKEIDTQSIPLINPSGVFLVAITSVGGRLVAVGEHGVVIYSDDGGATWSQAVVPVDVTLTCVSFITPTLGWAAGHFGVILGTTDGGKTWQRQLDGIQANKLTLIAAQAAVAQNNPSPGTDHALRRADAFVEEGTSIPFLTVATVSPEKVIVFGADRMTMITTDAGKTWADWSLNVFEPYSHNIYVAAVVGSDIYIGGEQGLIFRSTDGGGTFLPVTPASDVTVFGILSPTDNAIVVYGVAGSCSRSNDGCKTWTKINLPTQDDITTGRRLKSGKILLASEGGTFFVSNDDGVTFNLVRGMQPGSVSDMEMSPTGDLIVVGSSGVRRIPKTFFDA